MTPLVAYAATACRLYIGLALIVAVVGKAAAMAAFRIAVAELTGLAPRAAGIVAPAVVTAETAIVAALVVVPRLGMAAAMFLFAIFSIAILAALARGRIVACNCFGGASRPVSWLDLVRNLALIAACAAFLLWPAAPFEPRAWLLLLGVALIALLISLHLDEIGAPGR
jgi:hypothetical protein